MSSREILRILKQRGILALVIDALAPYGVSHIDLPCNGENVWRALEEARS